MSDWSLHHGPCYGWLHTLEDKSVDHVITDPPYDEHVHSKSRRGASMPDTAEQPCRYNRAHEFGFEAITPEQIRFCAEQFARLSRRWVMVFSNIELAPAWREAMIGAGLDYVRTMAWIKLCATPQMTGDRPAAGFEAITLAHPKGRKKWNGGGKQGVYSHAVVQNRNGHRHDRVHTAQKPIELMLDLVDDFTDKDDLVLDPFAGSGTTGAAALRRGRWFIGAEVMPRPDHPEDANYHELACDRLRAEVSGSTLQAVRAGQTTLFGGAK